VTSELGYSGFRTAGGIKLLEEFCNDLMFLIADKRRRKIIYREAKEIVPDSEKLYHDAIEDLRELQRNLREYRKKQPSVGQ
jgi:hypothetical protein